MDETRLSHAEPSQTLMLQCPTCGSDAADTLGVTGSIGGLPDATVVMRCEGCSTVYLSPAPVENSGSPPGTSTPVPGRRRLDRWTRGLPRAARILCCDCDPGWYRAALLQAGNGGSVIECTDPEHRLIEPGSYDLVLLSHSLESAQDPGTLLKQAAGLLTIHGRIVVVTSNAGSSCFGAFGGRHWSGYRFPWTRQHLTPDALGTLCKIVGLRLAELDTLFVADAWLTSATNWLQDWGANDRVIRLFTGRWLLPLAVASLLESVAVMRGRGSLLVAQLERPCPDSG